MTKKERELIYDEGLEVFGEDCQYDQCVEEMAELMVAINKLKRQKNYGEYQGNESIMQNFYEELADVFICVEGLAYMFANDKFDEIVEKKMLKFKRTIDKCRPLMK